MKRTALCAFLIFIVAVSFCVKAGAEEKSLDYSGNFWSRPALTGDWKGARNALAENGVTFDLNLTQVVQGDTGGGRKTGWDYGGRGDLTVNVDTQKLGLWPGGFFTLEVEGNFGNDVNFNTGAIMPVNSNQFYPEPGSDQLNIPEVMFTQFLSKHAGMFAGKIDMTTGDANEFAHGKGDTQFFNLAFNFNPVALFAVPYSTLGAGVMLLPAKDPGSAAVAVSAVSSDGKANSSGFDTLFEGNTTYSIEGRVKTGFFGLTGHQLAGGMYSTKNFAALEQHLRFIIQNGAIEKKGDTWCVYYNFDQYIYEVKKGSGRGVGIFGRFGVSDGNPNPMHFFYSAGLGGKGVVPGRPLDAFGLGFYYIDISNPKLIGPFVTRVFLRNEYGVEAYYNVALTPWAQLTPDIQFVRPAQKRTLIVNMAGGQLVSGSNIDTATVLGLRLRLVF